MAVLRVPAGIKITIDGEEGVSDLGLAFQGRLEEVVEERLGIVKRGYVAAAGQVMAKDKARLRADIAAGGFYRADRLAKTWQGKVYPDHAPSLEPAIWLSSNAQTIIDTFSQGVTISVRNARFLAIPQGPAKAIVHRLNQAGNRTRNGFGRFQAEGGTVERVAAALGVELVPVIDKLSGNGVLIAADSRRLTPGGRNAKHQDGRGTVLFALVKQATLKKRIQGRALLEQLKASFEVDFVGALAAALPPEAQ